MGHWMRGWGSTAAADVRGGWLSIGIGSGGSLHFHWAGETFSEYRSGIGIAVAAAHDAGTTLEGIH